MMEKNIGQNVTTFAAGPGKLPDAVIESSINALRCFGEDGVSLLSVSHRGLGFTQLVTSASKMVTDMCFPGFTEPSHDVIWMQGGATLQFAAAPMNLAAKALHKKSFSEATGVYFTCGAWSRKAHEEAARLGFNVTALPMPTPTCADQKGSFITRVVKIMNDVVEKDTPDFVYLCSNETIDGVALPLDDIAKTLQKKTLSVVDMSSEFLSRKVERLPDFDIIFAGAQKNLGAAGVTCVLVRKALLRNAKGIQLPVMMDYSVAVDASSLYNTPPVFSIFTCHECLKWIKDFEYFGLKGPEAVFAQNIEKAKGLYAVIDGSRHFKCNVQDVGARSITNVVFRICKIDKTGADADTEKRFLSEARKQGMVGLEGHRSVGGIRASLYNAVTTSDVKRLSDFITTFDKTI